MLAKSMNLSLQWAQAQRNWTCEEDDWCYFCLQPMAVGVLCLAAEPRTPEPDAATSHTVSHTADQSSSNQEEELYPGPGVYEKKKEKEKNMFILGSIRISCSFSLDKFSL